MGDRPSAYLKDGAKLQRPRKAQLQVEGEPQMFESAQSLTRRIATLFNTVRQHHRYCYQRAS